MGFVNSIIGIGAIVTRIAPVDTCAAAAAYSRVTVKRYINESNDAEPLSVAD